MNADGRFHLVVVIRAYPQSKRFKFAHRAKISAHGNSVNLFFVCFVYFVVILKRAVLKETTTKYTKHTKVPMEAVHKAECDAIMGACFEVSLKATGLKLGLLVNFGHFPKLEYKRIVR